MKRVFPLFLVAALAGPFAASAQMPIPAAHPHSLSLQVVPVSTGTTVQDTFNTRQQRGNFNGHGRQSRRTTRTETTEGKAAIEISVRNFGTQADTASVEWYFVAEPAHPDMGRPLASQRFIFDKGSQAVNLAANGGTKIPVTSQAVTAESVHRGRGRAPRFNGKKKTDARRKPPKPADSGDKLSGWIVRVVADGRTLECKGSKQELEDAGKDNTKLAAMTVKD